MLFILFEVIIIIQKYSHCSVMIFFRHSPSYGGVNMNGLGIAQDAALAKLGPVRSHPTFAIHRISAQRRQQQRSRAGNIIPCAQKSLVQIS
jgi:hypothetical protein